MNKLVNLVRVRQWLTGSALLAAGLFGGSQALAVDEADLITAEGIVQEVSLPTGQVLITGIRYDVEPQAKVNVRGVASSIAALEEGMKVSFVYMVMDGFDAQIAAREEASIITELQQLPDSTALLEF